MKHVVRSNLAKRTQLFATVISSQPVLKHQVRDSGSHARAARGIRKSARVRLAKYVFHRAAISCRARPDHFRLPRGQGHMQRFGEFEPPVSHPCESGGVRTYTASAPKRFAASCNRGCAGGASRMAFPAVAPESRPDRQQSFAMRRYVVTSARDLIDRNDRCGYVIADRPPCLPRRCATRGGCRRKRSTRITRRRLAILPAVARMN